MALAAVRRIFIALFLAACAGTTLDLLLIGHVESVWQRVPLVLLAVSLFAFAAVARRPSRTLLRLFQAVMLLVALAAVVGLGLHLRANLEFEEEARRDVTGFALLWKAIQGPAPPSLAPGTLLVVTLSGLAWSWHHPVGRASP